MRTKTIGMLILAAVTLAACERKKEPNKVLDGYVSGSTEVVIPAEAAQKMFLLKRDMLAVVVVVINKIENLTASFPELTGPVASKYSFQVSERHYGDATFEIEFLDDTNTTIDPISVRTSSTSLKSVRVTETNASNEFTEDLSIVLESSGVVTSPLRLTGTTVFNDGTYSLTFTFASSGCRVTFQGLVDGNVSATGTGGTPAVPTMIELGFSSDRNANGSIAWEGRTGGLHLEDNGSGFVSEPAGRILLD